MKQTSTLVQQMYAKDTSKTLKDYLNQQQAEDFRLPMVCCYGINILVILKGIRRVIIPVRHDKPGQNCCLFELDTICQLIETDVQSNGQIFCPACRQSVYINQFGVDRLTYHIISQMKFQGLDQQIFKKQISYKKASRKFYAVHLDEKTERFTEIQGINYCKTIVTNRGLNERISTIKDIVLKKVKNCTIAAASFGLQDQIEGLIPQQVSKVLDEIFKLIYQKMGIKVVGKQDDSFRAFCFGLQKKFPPNMKLLYDTNGSYLNIFHPALQIFHQYTLQISENNQQTDFIYNEAALGLKSIDKDQYNEIFLLGGLKKGEKTKISSSDFYEIRIQVDPKDQSQTSKIVKKLPNLPYDCCLPMGVYDNGKIYLLGGVQYLSPQNIQINSDVYVYENGKWSDLKCKLPNPRVDGTVDFNRTTKIVALIGGHKLNPRQLNLSDREQEQVVKVDILNLNNFKFGSFDLDFKLINSKVLTNRCLIAVVQLNEDILIFNGNSLGETNYPDNFKPSVVNLLYKGKSLNQNNEFSSKSVYVLDRVGNTNNLSKINDCQFQMLIHDHEGAIIDGVFYTIYNRPDNFKHTDGPQTLKFCAYVYDCATGKNTFYEFKQLETQIGKANIYLNGLTQVQTTKTPFQKFNIRIITEEEYTQDQFD